MSIKDSGTAWLAMSVVAIVSLVFGGMLFVTFAGHLATPWIEPEFANKDFANYWTAGKLILAGDVMDLFGPHAGYFRHLTAAFGSEYQWHNWSYPPHYLLFIWPLGYLGYETGLVVFVLATLALFLVAVRAYAGTTFPLILLAVGPFIVLNAWTAQNGFLSGALALGALALRDSRPIVAGILLGMLTIKPQLGVLFPFLLLAEQRWRMIASATVTTVALFCVSAFVFGVEAWVGYVNEVLPYQSQVMKYLQGTFLTMVPSAYGAARLYGADFPIAMAIHLSLAIPAFLASVYLFFRLSNDSDRALLLLLATFVITPYALNYDLGLVSVAAGLLAGRYLAIPDAFGTERVVLALLMMMPLYMMPLGFSGMHAGPVLIIAAILFHLQQAEFRSAPLMFRRMSPAAASD
jgi:arabinofuranan 3-O-arabinosyltransferase